MFFKHITLTKLVSIFILWLMLTMLLVQASANASDDLLVVRDALVSDSSDALTVVRQFWELFNQRQFDELTRVMADNILLIDARGQVIAGKARVRQFLMQNARQIELADIWLAGNQIAWTARGQGNGTAIPQSGWAVIQGGRITVLALSD